MKRIVFIVAALVFSLLAATCDKVKHPLPPVDNSLKIKDTLRKTNANAANLNTRKVMLEDYTGHFCGNCPRAARKAEVLKNTYGDRLVIMASHVTPIYAEPKSDTMYREEFRNPASNDWDGTMGISSAPGLPRGSVNRTIPYAIGEGVWESTIVSELARPQAAKMILTSYYDSTLKVLNVQVKTTFLQAFSGNINLIVALTQNDIIADQKDYSPPAGSVVIDGDLRPDYKFEHLVIGSMNGSWGQLVKAAPAVNDAVTLLTGNYSLARCFYKNSVCIDPHHVDVIAFIYNEATKEILHVETIKIMN